MSIQISGISKRFGSFQALNNVSLDLASGKLISLLGPSGCGKTTLLRIIAGLEHADQGHIVLNGVDTTNRHVRERRVGFVFQHYALFRHMTIFENVAFGLRMRPRKTRPDEKTIRQKVNGLLELVQLGWVGDRYPSQLSGGQRQRVALARALAIEPEILLLDEPFGALDARVRKDLRRWLRKLHDDLPITSIFVTHDQEEALEVADTVVLMNKGQVEQIGAPEVLYHHPQTAFVAGFIGSVNLFHGRARPDGIHLGADFIARNMKHAGNPPTGHEVLAFARPHEIDILPETETNRGVPAQISRIQSFGLTSRIELRGLNGHCAHVYEVELMKQQANMQNLKEGLRVRLTPSGMRLFESNASACEI